MVLLEVLTLIIGTTYGYLKPGKEDRISLFKKGLLIGTILGILFTILGAIVNIKFIFLSSIVGIVLFIQIIIYVIIFIIGTYIGDILEEKNRKYKLNKNRYL